MYCKTCTGTFRVGYDFCLYLFPHNFTIATRMYGVSNPLKTIVNSFSGLFIKYIH